MKTLYKSIMMSCAVLSAGWILPSYSYAAVNVQVNDQVLTFDDAKPFVQSNRLQVPLRAVSEELGFDVSWKPDGSIVISNGEKSIVLDAKSSAVSSKGRVYVPLRFVSEELGVNVDWYSKNKVAVLEEDGAEHAPLVSAAEKRVLNTASSYLGVPYVYGGSTTNGFDCSGFVNYVFDKYGIDLPRTSGQMFKSAGVRTQDLQPADLVFFGNGKSIGHVGIYIGDKKFISASSRGVSISSISDKYWGPKYMGAKKVL